MPKLDSNAAWIEATGIVSANRDVLFTLAGVFFFLPGLAATVLIEKVSIEPNMKPEQARALMLEFYAHNWWILLGMIILLLIGFLAIMTLMRDSRRPTVGEAIQASAGGAPTYLAAEFLLLLLITLVGGILMGLGLAISPALGATLLWAVLVFFGIRALLISPLVAVEGMRNPLAVLGRSWRLTGGNFWRLWSFVVLLSLPFLLGFLIVRWASGAILAVIVEPGTQELVEAIINGAIITVALVYFAAVIAAIHRQLGGPAAADLSATFE